jgi:hypothetical protein
MKTPLSQQLPESGAENPFSSVCCGGSNGVGLAVIALSWWILVLKGNTEGSKITEALNDILWVLDSMVTYLSQNDGGSRKLTTNPEQSGNATLSKKRRGRSADNGKGKRRKL